MFAIAAAVATAVTAVEVPQGSPALRWSFVALALLLTLLFVAAVIVSARRASGDAAVAKRQGIIAAAAAALWLGATGVAAASGLMRFEAPHTMLLAIPLTLALAIGVASSPLGRRVAVGLPLAALVGFQSFRVIVELLLHRAYIEGLMPVQMSYSGRNFDIVSGVTAVLVGVWLATGRRSPRLVLLWNTLGVLLLANILGVALLSAPTPLRMFMNEPANVWIERAPWIWLPAVMVFSAVLGHALVYRRLWIDARGRAANRMGAHEPSYSI